MLKAALEATQGQMGGFLSQLPYKCHPSRWRLWEVDLRFALNSTPMRGHLPRVIYHQVY